MVQGTGSDVGKSLLVTGLCRAYTRRGLQVRPFKPQNMSNNAAVTADGGEIGRAQALQARACGVEPSVHMNPVLLKPQSDVGAQVVVLGSVEPTAQARDYHALKPLLLPRVLDSFAKIGAGADLVLVEGAGSPAEVNLRDSDIANMGFAEAADVPVVLVGDVERGGVIAALVGTHALLDEPEQGRLVGYVINKFRGDIGLFDAALDVIGERTGLSCFGVVPYFAAARLLPKEDAQSLDGDPGTGAGPGEAGGAPIKVAVPRLSRIANFDDLDPLMAEPDVDVEVVEAGHPLPVDVDVVVLPGTKATLADLAYVRQQGWDVDVAAHARRGGLVVGLCGGYQMLGRRVTDPDGIEGAPGEAARVAEHSDVEPKEMPFHLSAQAKLQALKPDAVRNWHFSRCRIDWLRSECLAFLHRGLRDTTVKEPPAGALNAHYAAVLRTGWESDDLAAVISTSRSPMSHIQRDGDSLIFWGRYK